MKSIPSGYRELLQLVMEGPLNDKEKIYCLCENLWSGVNRWYEEMRLDDQVKELPLWLAK